MNRAIGDRPSLIEQRIGLLRELRNVGRWVNTCDMRYRAELRKAYGGHAAEARYNTHHISPACDAACRAFAAQGERYGRVWNAYYEVAKAMQAAMHPQRSQARH